MIILVRLRKDPTLIFCHLIELGPGRKMSQIHDADDG